MSTLTREGSRQDLGLIGMIGAELEYDFALLLPNAARLLIRRPDLRMVPAKPTAGTDMSYSPSEAARIEATWHAEDGGSCFVLAETSSTQDEVRSRSKNGSPPSLLVVASKQNQGRGTRGRTWQQDTHDDISFSFSVRFAPSDARQLEPLLLPMLAAVAIRAGVLSALPHSVDAARARSRLRLKWPNDVLVDGRKLAGILIESTGEASWIVGIGLNVHRQTFPPEIAGIATSLDLAFGPDASIDRCAILCSILKSWKEIFAAARAGHATALVAMYEEGLGLIGDRVELRVRGACIHGTLASVTPRAVRLDDGRSYAPGEVEALSRSSKE